MNYLRIAGTILPTFVSLAGSSVPDNGKIYDGVNIWPYLNKKGQLSSKEGPLHELLIWDQNEGENYDWSVPIEYFTWEETDRNIDIGIRMGNLKLRVFQGEITMYNLAEDIGETNNVIDRYSAEFEIMKTAYNKWHSQMHPQLEAVNKAKSGCLDPRFVEYESDLSTVTRHAGSKCQTLIEKTGCRDPKAVNFDYTVTDHDQSMCEYGDEIATPPDRVEPLNPPYPVINTGSAPGGQ